LSKWT